MKEFITDFFYRWCDEILPDDGQWPTAFLQFRERSSHALVGLRSTNLSGLQLVRAHFRAQLRIWRDLGFPQ